MNGAPTSSDKAFSQLPEEFTRQVRRLFENEAIADKRAALKAALQSLGADAGRVLNGEHTPVDLMRVAALGDRELVQIMLDAGASVQKNATDGHNPLCFANNASVAELLLSRGADLGHGCVVALALSERNEAMLSFFIAQGWFSRHMFDGVGVLCSAIKSGWRRGVQLLLAGGATAKSSPRAFELFEAAITTGNVDAVEQLLAFGFKPDVRSKSNETTPLMLAAGTGRDPIMERLLKAGADVRAKSTSEPVKFYTPLHFAAVGGSVPCVARLLKAGAPLDSVTARKETALLLATMNNHTEVAKLLIAAKAKVKYDSTLRSPLTLAAERDNDEIVRAILDAGNVSSLSEAIYDAARAGAMRCLPLLILALPINERRDKVNAAMEDETTALSMAAEQGHLEAVRLLLASGADPNLGESAVANAVLSGHKEVSLLLLNSGAKLSLCRETEDLYMSFAAGNVNAHLVLTSKYGDDVRLESAPEGHHVMLVAAEHGNVTAGRWLLQHGACHCSKGLGMAAEKGHANFVRMMLSWGMSIEDCQFAVKRATETRQTACVDVLRAHIATLQSSGKGAESKKKKAKRRGKQKAGEQPAGASAAVPGSQSQEADDADSDAAVDSVPEPAPAGSFGLPGSVVVDCAPGGSVPPPGSTQVSLEEFLRDPQFHGQDFGFAQSRVYELIEKGLLSNPEELFQSLLGGRPGEQGISVQLSSPDPGSPEVFLVALPEDCPDSDAAGGAGGGVVISSSASRPADSAHRKHGKSQPTAKRRSVAKPAQLPVTPTKGPAAASAALSAADVRVVPPPATSSARAVAEARVLPPPAPAAKPASVEPPADDRQPAASTKPKPPKEPAKPAASKAAKPLSAPSPERLPAGASGVPASSLSSGSSPAPPPLSGASSATLPSQDVLPDRAEPAGTAAVVSDGAARSALSLQVRTLTDKQAEHGATIASLRAAEADLRCQLEAAHSRLAKSEKRAERLDADLRSAQSEAKSAQAELRGAQAELTKTQAAAKSAQLLQPELSKAQSDLRASQAELAAVRTRLLPAQQRVNLNTGDGLETLSVAELGELKEQLGNAKRLVKTSKKTRIIDEEQCKVCMNAAASTVCVPCGHQVLCGACAARITKQCPFCRSPIQTILPVFKV